MLGLLPEAKAQINIGKLKDKVGGKKEEPQKPTPNPTQTKTSPNQAAAELDFSAGTPEWSYFALFRGISLAEKTGELQLNEVALFNLPQKEKNGKDADYYNAHKIELVVSQLNPQDQPVKVVGKATATPSFSSGVASLSIQNGTMKVDAIGNHTLDLVIDGKTYQSFKFFVKKGTKDGVTRYFLSEPWGLISYLKVNNDATPLELGYYYALQTMDDAQSDEGKDAVAKLIDEDTEDVVAVHLNTSGGRYKKRRWATLMMTFYDAQNPNMPFIGSKLLSRNGNYSLRLKFGKDGNYDEKYIYRFKVEGGKIMGQEGFKVIKDRDAYNEIDMVWLQGDVEGAVKMEEGASPVMSIAGVKENIALMIGNRGCRPPQACAINDGDLVALSDMVLNELQDQTIFKDLFCTLTLMQGDKILAQHGWLQDCGDRGCNQLYISLVANPEHFNFSNQSTAFVNALAALPPGAQKLTLVAQIQYGKDKKKVVGYRNFTFNSAAGNPKYKAIAEKLGKRINMSEADLNAEWWEKFGGPDPVTLVNNCGRTVWLRKSIGSDKREVRIPPGGTFHYDTNEGYLEQWNFGTGRWTSVQNVFTNRQGDKCNICK
ncbi:MAG: hypothetical protein OHK0053_30470 [Microscillaceae bacterium]